jgi:hypothetical protein
MFCKKVLSLSKTCKFEQAYSRKYYIKKYVCISLVQSPEFQSLLGLVYF